MRKQRKHALLSLFLAFTLFSSLFATSLPSPTSLKYIHDYAGIMNDTSLKQVVGIGKELEDSTGAQATVVILSSLDGIPIEDYALQLFRTWGIGQAGKDNGLLLLVALQDRQWRVEVGRGLEGAIPDALSNRVMEEIAKPLFAEGNYPLGIVNAYSSFCDLIAKEYGVTLSKSLNIPLPTETTSSNGGMSLPLIVVILLLLDLLLNRGRIFSSFLQILFWNNIGRRGGGGYGGGGGGGFGNFGGGSSNGGGSSGNW